MTATRSSDATGERSESVCPRCTSPVKVTQEEWYSCSACVARHHAACWGERCSGCGSTEGLGPLPPVAEDALEVAAHGRLAPVPLAKGSEAVARAIVIALLFLLLGGGAVALRARKSAPRVTPAAPSVAAPSHADEIDALGRKARALLDEQKWDEARAVAQQAIDLDEGNATGWYYRALAVGHRADGDLDELSRARGFARALDDFARATELDPTHGRAWLGLSYFHELRGESTLALEEGERAVELLPLQAYPLRARAAAHLGRGELAEALRDVEKSLSYDASNEYAYETRGAIRTLLLDREGAIEDLERARQLQVFKKPAVDVRMKERLDRATALPEALEARTEERREVARLVLDLLDGGSSSAGVLLIGQRGRTSPELLAPWLRDKTRLGNTSVRVIVARALLEAQGGPEGFSSVIDAIERDDRLESRAWEDFVSGWESRAR